MLMALPGIHHSSACFQVYTTSIALCRYKAPTQLHLLHVPASLRARCASL